MPTAGNRVTFPSSRLARLEGSQILSATAHCYARCFTHTPGTRLSLGWADRTEDVISCPLFLCSLHESFHCDRAQNSHYESQLDLGSKPGEQGTGAFTQNLLCKMH